MLGEVMHYVFNKPWHIAFLAGIALLPLAPCFLSLARMRIRRAHKLQGNALVDVACTSSCCCCCSACQIRDEIFYLREDKEWRLAFRTKEPERSPYVKPCLDMYGDFKKYRERKRAEREEAIRRATLRTVDVDEPESESVGPDGETVGTQEKFDEFPKRKSQVRKSSRKTQEIPDEEEFEEKRAAQEKFSDATASSKYQRQARKPPPRREGGRGEDEFGDNRLSRKSINEAAAYSAPVRRVGKQTPDLEERTSEERLAQKRQAPETFHHITATPKRQRRDSTPAADVQEGHFERRSRENGPRRQRMDDVGESSWPGRQAGRQRSYREESYAEDRFDKKRENSESFYHTTVSPKRQSQARAPSPGDWEGRVNERSRENGPRRQRMDDVGESSGPGRRADRQRSYHEERYAEDRLDKKRTISEKLQPTTSSPNHPNQARTPSPDVRQGRVEERWKENGPRWADRQRSYHEERYAEDRLDKKRTISEKLQPTTSSPNHPNQARTPPPDVRQGRVEERWKENGPRRADRQRSYHEERYAEDRLDKKRTMSEKLQPTTSSPNHPNQARTPSPDVRQGRVEERGKENGPRRADRQRSYHEERYAEGRLDKKRTMSEKLQPTTASPNRQHQARLSSPNVRGAERPKENGPSRQKINDVGASSVPVRRADKQTPDREERKAGNRVENKGQNQEKANNVAASSKPQNQARISSPNARGAERPKENGPNRQKINDVAASPRPPGLAGKQTPAREERRTDNRPENKRTNQEKPNNVAASSKPQNQARSPSPNIRGAERPKENGPNRQKINDVAASLMPPGLAGKLAAAQNKLQKMTENTKKQNASSSPKRQK